MVEYCFTPWENENVLDLVKCVSVNLISRQQDPGGLRIHDVIVFKANEWKSLKVICVHLSQAIYSGKTFLVHFLVLVKFGNIFNNGII